ncbi:MAG: 16S rRNA (guanine(527)-N(7))-methyltransferase RsmG [Bacteroidales bacterium]|nr:16S rRNA (guanine(527)-N(7))-methyltransferase RsmG [Bacteroidales bacterium]
MQLIEKYFPALTDIQKKQFSLLEPLYREWNSKVNVISRKDIENLYLKHVLHSLAIAKYPGFRDGLEVIDVGTGGGFPGIPLAIMFPESRFILVDSVGKKIKVVQAIVDELELKNATAVHARIEDIKNQADFIVSRAVTELHKFIRWVKKNIRNGDGDLMRGILYLKGGDFSEELKIPYKSRIINIPDFFDEPFFESKKIAHIIFMR